MSAYMVDRMHIEYLIAAASSRRINHNGGGIYFAGQSFGMCEGRERSTEIGQMLWDENRKSIDYRYPDCAGSNDNVPGEIGEDFVYNYEGRCWNEYDPAQVIKACHCYRYQSCEHRGWEESTAKAFIDALESAAVHAMPGYEDAEWGAPEPQCGTIRLSGLR